MNPFESPEAVDVVKTNLRDSLKGCVIPLMCLLCALFFGAGWYAHAGFSAAN